MVGKAALSRRPLCLIHGELSEALEEYRNGSPLVYGTCALSPDDCDFALTCENVGHPDARRGKGRSLQAGGIAVERADVIEPSTSWPRSG